MSEEAYEILLETAKKLNMGLGAVAMLCLKKVVYESEHGIPPNRDKLQNKGRWKPGKYRKKPYDFPKLNNEYKGTVTYNKKPTPYTVYFYATKEEHNAMQAMRLFAKVSVSSVVDAAVQEVCPWLNELYDEHGGKMWEIHKELFHKIYCSMKVAYLTEKFRSRNVRQLAITTVKFRGKQAKTAQFLRNRRDEAALLEAEVPIDYWAPPR